MKKQLEKEFEFLKSYANKSIAISTTAKHAVDFAILPRRVYEDMGIVSIMINSEQLLLEVLNYFDSRVDTIYIDTELKQKINLLKIVTDKIEYAQVITMKPNDTTLESLDILIRNKFNDNLINKNILVIGTGNLASKIVMRLAERQANVFIMGRSVEKSLETRNALNLFLPAYSSPIKTFEEIKESFDIIIGAISSEFNKEALIAPFINKKTLVIDVGINNFRKEFIETYISSNEILRLDTRIALAYQMISENSYTKNFFENVIGTKIIKDITVVAGGVIGEAGSIILDQLTKPTQVIGVADGYGGLKKNESFEEKEKINIIRKYITEGI